MLETYEVGPMIVRDRRIGVLVEAESPEEARAKARPQLRKEGVPDSDPLVVGRVQPVRGDDYGDE